MKTDSAVMNKPCDKCTLIEKIMEEAELSPFCDEDLAMMLGMEIIEKYRALKNENRD